MSKQQEKKAGVGAFDFFCIGFGAIVGVGWAVSINNWMANCGGPLPAAVGYILALVMMIPVALCYCELVPMLPVAGGGMAFAYKAFGEKVGFISGWAAFGAFVTIIPWEAIYIVDTLSILIPALKAGSPLYTLAGYDIYIGNIVLGLAFSLVIFAINWKGATSSAVVQRVLCVVLVAGGILAMICAIFKCDFSNLLPVYENVKETSHNSFMGGAVAILASAPFFLAGFETIPQAIEESNGDTKSIGKTVVLSVGLACVFYALLLFTLGTAMPWQEFYSLPTPAAANLLGIVYGGGVGKTLYTIILVCATCGLLTTWNGFMMASPRLMMALARANMIPKWFAKQHPKYGTPSNSMICCLILSIAGPFLGLGLIDPLTSFSAAGFVCSWMLTSYCVIKLRKSEPNMNRPYKIPGGVATAWFAAIVMTVVFILLFVPASPCYMGSMACILFVIWMVLGFILYFASAGQRNQLTPEERSASLFAKMND